MKSAITHEAASHEIRYHTMETALREPRSLGSSDQTRLGRDSIHTTVIACRSNHA